jgi:SWIM zinc finger
VAVALASSSGVTSGWGTDYRIRPITTPPVGYRSVWTLRKQDPTSSATYTVSQAKGEDAACTCPDHEHNGAVCKHVMALAALGLVRRPKAARPKPAPSARARKAHARRLAETGPAAEFRSAVRKEVARQQGEPPIPPECGECGQEFDPAVSRDPHFCSDCLDRERGFPDV